MGGYSRLRSIGLNMYRLPAVHHSTDLMTEMWWLEMFELYCMDNTIGTGLTLTM